MTGSSDTIYDTFGHYWFGGGWHRCTYGPDLEVVRGLPCWQSSRRAAHVLAARERVDADRDERDALNGWTWDGEAWVLMRETEVAA